MAAPVRAEPGDAAGQVTQLLRGEPVTVDERRDGWARIRTAYDYPGWVAEDALEPREADPHWLAASDDDPVEAARVYLGAPYEWGGMTERGIDCSGLVHMAYRCTGRLVPRDAHQQEAAATPVTEPDLRPGDLVCFGEPGRADHIAFWLAPDLVLHATSRRGCVVEEPLAAVHAEPVRYVRL